MHTYMEILGFFSLLDNQFRDEINNSSHYNLGSTWNCMGKLPPLGLYICVYTRIDLKLYLKDPL